MKLKLVAAALALGSALTYACVGDNTTTPQDSGTDGSVSDVAPADVNGGGCDGGMICNTVCVAVSSDPKNCGRCAHDCGPGKCSAGICQPVLIDGNPDAGVEAGVITSLTTDQTDDNPAGAAQHVFWSMTGNSGGVFQDNVLGGNVVKLSTTLVVPLTNVVVSQTNVFWFLQNLGGPQQPVVKGQVSGAGSQTGLGSINGSFIQSILFDPGSQNIFGSYEVNSTQHGAFKCALGTSVTCTNVTTLTGQPGGNVAMDSTHMYFSDPNNGGIEDITFTGNASSFVQNQATPTLLRVDGTSLYWFNSGSKSISRAALAGPTPKPVATSSNAIDGLAADSVNVYWTESPTGTVSFAPITGAGPNTAYVTMGASATPMRLVRDTGFLYFSHNGAIYRVALP